MIHERGSPDDSRGWQQAIHRYFLPRPSVDDPRLPPIALLSCIVLYVFLGWTFLLFLSPSKTDSNNVTESAPREIVTDGSPTPLPTSDGKPAPKTAPRDATASLVVLALQNLAFFITAVAVLAWLAPGYVRARLGLANMPRAVLFGLKNAIVWTPFVLALSELVSRVVPDRQLHPALDALKSVDPSMLIAIWISSVIAAPLAEELLFRGLVQSWAETWNVRSTWPAILFASAVFALFHPRVDQLPVVVLAIGFGLSFAYTGSLWTSIAFHVAFNTINMTIATLTLR